MLLRKLAADSDLAAYLLKQPGFPRIEVQTEDVPYTFGEWYGIDTFDAYTASMQANVFSLQSENKARMLMGMNFYWGASRCAERLSYDGASGVKLWAIESGARGMGCPPGDIPSRSGLSRGGHRSRSCGERRS
jgi:hypothetical protein